MAQRRQKVPPKARSRSARQTVESLRRSLTRERERRKEALEKQTAISEILRVISASPTDVQPVFDTIVKSALALCKGMYANVFRYDGGLLHFMATENHPGDLEFLKAKYPMRPDASQASGRVILTKAVVHIEDSFFDSNYDPSARSGWRRMLGVPMLREDTPLGVIVVAWDEPGPIVKHHEELLQTFADQAVIAIENVRLFNETKEALEQQTAISDVLRVISDSPSDVRPVLEAVAVRAANICEASDARILLVDGDRLRVAAGFGDVPPKAANIVLLDRRTASGRAVIDGTAVHLPDMLLAPVDEYPLGQENARRSGWRTILAVPLMREQQGLGAITLRRREVKPFTDKQIALLRTFADQAAIAIENVRLFNETKEALERQTATAEILQVISSSPTDVQPVFDTILSNGARLCEANFAALYLYDGEMLTVPAHQGALPELAEAFKTLRLAPSNAGAIRLAALERRIVQVADITKEPGFKPAVLQLQSARTVLGIPLLREKTLVGVLAMWRTEVRPFTDKQIALLKTFADQAVIAIENVRLFKELEARNKDLGESLEQQTATSEVLKVISRTQFDLQPVLQIVLDNACRLCDTDRAIVFRPDEDGNYRPVGATAQIDAPGSVTDGVLQRHPIAVNRESAAGRALVEGRTVHIVDVLTDAEYKRRDLADAASFRTILAVPMLREGSPVGVLTLSRKGEPRPFTQKQIELVTVFADQAVIAIENVRLFKEIQEKSAQLEVANKHKSEFLSNMSHELRTPLNAIIGFAEVLSERMFGEVNEKQADYLKDIHESGKHLLSLINDILDLSKIEAGRMDLELSSFHLPSAVSNAVTLIRERALRHGIALGVEIDERLGEFQADERKVKQILLNLLSNAVKFTPDGGRVDVSAKLDTDRVEIAVKDSGVGITPEDQASLFEEFKQLGKDSSRKAEGTGLGLALTKKFVELHGGAMRVESAPGKGSTFMFSLPMRVLARADRVIE